MTTTSSSTTAASTVPPARAGARRLLVRWLVLVPLGLAVLAGSRGLDAAAAGAPVLALVVGLASGAGALALYRAVVGRLERRRVGELAGTGAAGGLTRGFLVGFAAFTATIAAIALLGGYRVTGWGSVAPLVAGIGTMASVAVDEELLFRGVVFRLAEERLGSWGALVVSSLLFAGLHLVNPHATVWGATAIAVEAGGMLAAAYVATRSLWLPIGLHLAWNLAEGAVFGTTVSGDGHAAGLLSAVLHGPVAVAGGGFGPEASVPALIACLVPTVLLLRRAHRLGRLRPRASRATATAARARIGR